MRLNGQVLSQLEINQENPIGNIIGQKRPTIKNRVLDFEKWDKLLAIKPLPDEITDRSKISLENEEEYVSSSSIKSELDNSKAEERANLAKLEIERMRHEKEQNDIELMDAEFVKHISVQEQENLEK